MASDWVGLSDEEANALWESTDSDWELMKRTEKLLREKNAGKPAAADKAGGDEPVAYIQRDHLQKAMASPFLCRVEPTQRLPDFVPLYTRPQPQGGKE